ncbi:hypothetical protein ACFMPD_13175 [Sedimentitalea sp. HM32M-2]|uniref:hypothetical protein n=1 Tax=Sedimentitalea sp. HM32M-2 TaxID=3351566 RepID=UPI00362510E4
MDNFVFFSSGDATRSYLKIPDIAGESQFDPGAGLSVGDGSFDRSGDGGAIDPMAIWGTNGVALDGMHVDPVIPATGSFEDPLFG